MLDYDIATLVLDATAIGIPALVAVAVALHFVGNTWRKFRS